MKTAIRVFAFLLLLSCSASLNAQPDFSGGSIGVYYGKVNRSGLENYLAAVSDSFSLKGNLNAKNMYGISGMFHARTGKSEFQLGGTLGMSFSNFHSDSGSAVVFSCKTRSFGIHLGMNFFPVNFFYLGGALKLYSFNGDIKQHGELTSSMSTSLVPTESDANFLRGYSVAARGQAGFNFRYQKGGFAGLRLEGYCEIGTKFNFYTSLDHQLANYSGDKKSPYLAFGGSLILVFQLEY